MLRKDPPTIPLARLVAKAVHSALTPPFTSPGQLAVPPQLQEHLAEWTAYLCWYGNELAKDIRLDVGEPDTFTPTSLRHFSDAVLLTYFGLRGGFWLGDGGGPHFMELDKGWIVLSAPDLTGASEDAHQRLTAVAWGTLADPELIGPAPILVSTGPELSAAYYEILGDVLQPAVNTFVNCLITGPAHEPAGEPSDAA